MPKGIYIRTEKQIARLKIRGKKLGKNRKNKTPWNKNIVRTPKEKLNISIGTIKAIWGKDTNKRTIVDKCIICGKTRKRRPSEIENHRKILCSRKCFSKYRSLYLSGKNSSNWIESNKKCIICGKEFHIKPSHYNTRITCSYQCMARLYKQRMKGRGNPNYRGGVSFKKKCGLYGIGNSAYSKGKNSERKARILLQKQGYYVMRSGGSKGVFDLCAIKKDDLKLIQVKTNGFITKKEKEKIINFNNCPSNAKKELWIFYDKNKIPKIIEM